MADKVNVVGLAGETRPGYLQRLVPGDNGENKNLTLAKPIHGSFWDEVSGNNMLIATVPTRSVVPLPDVCAFHDMITIVIVNPPAPHRGRGSREGTKGARRVSFMELLYYCLRRNR